MRKRDTSVRAYIRVNVTDWGFVDEDLSQERGVDGQSANTS